MRFRVNDHGVSKEAINALWASIHLFLFRHIINPSDVGSLISPDPDHSKETNPTLTAEISLKRA